MARFAWIASLCLLAGSVAAGTFELSDPANEMYKEQQAQDVAEPEARAVFAPTPEATGDILCTVDTANGDCGCIDREMAKKLSMTQKECVDRVLRALKIWEP